MPILLSLVALHVVITTTYNAALQSWHHDHNNLRDIELQAGVSGDNIGIMTTLGFQCESYVYTTTPASDLTCGNEE